MHKKREGKKSLAILIDPDRNKLKNLDQIIDLSNQHAVDYFFIGGSLLAEDRFEFCIEKIKSGSEIPLVLFPGNQFQIHFAADALLFLSLVSSRNAEYLIGKQVEAAMKISESNIEVIATAYLLIDGGQSNTASYLSQSLPIPHDKVEVAVATAVASKLLNFQCIYLEAGSGAVNPVAPEMIRAVSKRGDLPLIVGGGLRSAEQLATAFHAGADLVVIGNAVESAPGLISSLAELKQTFHDKKSKA
ncbi:MAG: geranylgeranylglyceryl/heptaprenylglyceryl phosphate synthase [Saprospiraceae bacterium]|nr:geranylgeranylglyceryl/heptaprenylglyceryl phosphate synthase [Saprospiraceae bacterium]